MCQQPRLRRGFAGISCRMWPVLRTGLAARCAGLIVDLLQIRAMDGASPQRSCGYIRTEGAAISAPKVRPIRSA
jgi:hypothetical protein